MARFLLGLLKRDGAGLLVAARLVLVNGDLGMVIPPWPGDAGHPPVAGRVSCFAIRDGQVAGIYDIVNPDKIKRLAPVRPIDAAVTPCLPSPDRRNGVSRCKPGTVAPL